MDDAQEPIAEAPDAISPPPVEPVLVPPRGLWAVAIACFVLTAAVAILWAPAIRVRQQPSLVLATWQDADVDALRKVDDELLRQVAKSPEQAQLESEILKQFRGYLQREILLGGRVRDDAESRQLLGQIEEQVRTLVQRWGPVPFQRMSVQFGRDVRARATTTLLASASAHTPLQDYVRQQPLPADVSALTADAGALGYSLAQWGFHVYLNNGVLLPVAGQVLETMAQARFLSLGQRIPGGPPHLTLSAWQLALHFRLEAHPSIDTNQRLALIQELERVDPGYPSDFAHGVVLAREERYAEAAPFFDRAGQHGTLARQAKINARWCRDQARQHGAPPVGQVPITPPVGQAPALPAPPPAP